MLLLIFGQQTKCCVYTTPWGILGFVKSGMAGLKLLIQMPCHGLYFNSLCHYVSFMHMGCTTYSRQPHAHGHVILGLYQTLASE